jgi:cbb3-type cytochrome oxidase maturation protein
MSVIIILISASLLIAIGFLCAFIWSVKSGQYDDDYTPSVRMLFDEQTEQSVTITPDQQSKNHTT